MLIITYTLIYSCIRSTQNADESPVYGALTGKFLLFIVTTTS